MTSIVSSWITPASNARRCNNMFLTANGTSGNYAPSDTVSNVKYKGWDVVSPNTFFVNGEFDPWRSASLSSSWGPSRLQVEKQNITVIPGARHCWDQSMLNAQLNVDVLNVQTRGLMQVRGWLEVWYGVHADMNITNMMPAIAAQVGLPGGKPLTELIDMGTLSSGKSPVAGGGLGSSLTNNELATKGCTTLELVSLVANVVFLLIILVLIFGLLRARRARTHGSRMYTMDASFVPTIRYKNQIKAEDVLGGYVASRVINGGRGTYQKVENT
ncbi:hypothetical protein FRB94_003946 [Tulasnella sp. JGI-2019a]|nr:hypothetical protein FRB94_003946 [Tulasnella sp. JGI-2019a]KAG9008198.1 hypothetical protein FRB93_006766 [Tulasnella sp. JGI-2019a]